MVRAAAPVWMICVVLISTLASAGPARAQADDPKAVAVAHGVARLVTEATAVIGGLQADINAGEAADKTTPAGWS